VPAVVMLACISRHPIILEQESKFEHLYRDGAKITREVFFAFRLKMLVVN